MYGVCGIELSQMVKTVEILIWCVCGHCFFCNAVLSVLSSFGRKINIECLCFIEFIKLVGEHFIAFFATS